MNRDTPGAKLTYQDCRKEPIVAHRRCGQVRRCWLGQPDEPSRRGRGLVYLDRLRRGTPHGLGSAAYLVLRDEVDEGSFDTGVDSVV